MAKPHCLKRHFKRCGSNYCEVYYQNNILAERNKVFCRYRGVLWYILALVSGKSNKMTKFSKRFVQTWSTAGAKRILKFCSSFQGFEVLWFFQFSMVIPLVVDKKFFTGGLSLVETPVGETACPASSEERVAEPDVDQWLGMAEISEARSLMRSITRWTTNSFAHATRVGQWAKQFSAQCLLNNVNIPKNWLRGHTRVL